MGTLGEELIARVGVAEFFAAMGVTLEGRGEQLIGLCPFHDDHNPSFSVNASFGLWKCYAGCGEGDAISFFARVRGMEMESKAGFKLVAQAIEKEFMGGSIPQAPPRPTPPPRSTVSTEEQIAEWEKHATQFLTTWPLVKDYPAEYSVHLYKKGTTQEAFLLPVHHAPSGRIVGVKCRYLKEQPPWGQRKKPYKSENMHPWCRPCDKFAERACFKTHPDDLLRFPGGIIGLPALLAHPTSPVLLCEGEKDMLAAARRVDFAAAVPVSFSAGAGSLPEGTTELLQGRVVFICYDGDRSGVIGSKKVAKALAENGGDARILDLRLHPAHPVKGTKESKDLFDYFQAGGTPESLLEWARGLPPQVFKPPVSESPPAPTPTAYLSPTSEDSAPNLDSLRGSCYQNQRFQDDRPVIRITPHTDLMVDAAEDVLVKAKVEIFKRGNALVRIARAGKKKRAGEKFNRAVDAPFIDLIPPESLGESLSRVARWERWVKKDEEWTHTEVPDGIAKILMARASWKFRNLESISTSPFLRPDGTDCETPGWYPETEVLYDPIGTYPSVPERPTKEDAWEALGLLTEPFAEFRFVSPHDIACVVAAILTIAGRTAIDGPVPAFAATAPTPGAGKGLLVNLISTITLGHAPAVTPWVEDDRDWNNLITSFGAGGDPVVNIDNVDKTLQSEALASALTAVEYKARKFHSQRTLVVPLRMVWFITGNNFTTRGDLYRRILPIEIDPGDEDPERRIFKVSEEALLANTSRDRGALLVAALTVLRAHAVAGSPSVTGLAPLGSYGVWDRCVRQAVIWAMEEDPCAGLEKSKRVSDPDLRDMRGLLASWHNTIGEQPVTINELIAKARCLENIPLLDALSSLNYKRDEPPSVKTLGNLFSKHAGRPHGGLRLTVAGQDRNKTAIWVVKPLVSQ